MTAQVDSSGVVESAALFLLAMVISFCVSSQIMDEETILQM